MRSVFYTISAILLLTVASFIAMVRHNRIHAQEQAMLQLMGGEKIYRAYNDIMKGLSVALASDVEIVRDNPTVLNFNFTFGAEQQIWLGNNINLYRDFVRMYGQDELGVVVDLDTGGLWQKIQDGSFAYVVNPYKINYTATLGPSMELTINFSQIDETINSTILLDLGEPLDAYTWTSTGAGSIPVEIAVAGSALPVRNLGSGYYELDFGVGGNITVDLSSASKIVVDMSEMNATSRFLRVSTYLNENPVSGRIQVLVPGVVLNVSDTYSDISSNSVLEG